jgi:hypothetical protein
MKKQGLLFFALLVFGNIFSQNVFPTAINTNVGIGTGATVPSTRFQLTSATSGTSGFRLTNLLSTTAVTTGFLGKALSVDTLGNVVLVPVANTDSSIYNIDGSITSARTVSMAGFNLTFNPSTAGSPFFINGTTGNTGVGTTTPATKFEIKSTTVGTSGFRLTNLLSTTAVTTGLLGKALSVNATGDIILVPVANADTSLFAADGALASARTLLMGGNNLTINPSAANSQFFINGTTGNTGIGNVNPTVKLEVTSSTAGASGVKLTNLLSTSPTVTANGKGLSVDASGNVILVPITGGGVDMYTTDGVLSTNRTVSMSGKNYTFNPSTANSQFFINGTTGNTGIGNVTPTAKLEVTSSTAGASGVKLTNLLSTSPTVAANGKGLSVDASGNVILVPITGGGVDMYTTDGALSTNRTVSMSGKNYTFNPSNLNSQFFVNGVNGNIGIGTTIPTSKLDVKGGTSIGASYAGVTAAPANGAIIEGNVGVGTNAPSTKLHVFTGIEGDSGFRLNNLTSTSSTTTGNNKALSVDANGKVVLVPVVNTITAANTLYSADDSLTNNRTVGMGGKNLTFATSTTSGTSILSVNGTSGNIGIGTSNPTSKLDVNGDINSNRGIFNSNQSNGQTYPSTLARNDESIVFAAGSVIGTGTGYIKTRMLNFFDFPGSVSGSNNNSVAWFGIEDRNDQGRFRMIATTGGDTQMAMLNKSQQDLMKVYEDGNDKVTMTLPKSDSYLGIGTSSFLDATDSKTYRLSVKGRIRAEEVKVYNTWADYVFNKNYNLPPLKEVEGYIKENGHLPNVPSAKEVTEKGLELGEMAKIQQEKIEELTLYLIQQNKEIEELKLQVKLLMDKKK